ncbi:probable 28S ribosomal protein S23, mitochondrial [Dreissena polymorpha]|uniref:Small ribosomal subunit protein mS23 n=1 Tax=Dreissena polymorpha TaxID=45954 RepID=A0A9D4S609_DREPO|nr:probable 28S ribosomal protein S23, mitochondrial [Dreissena polymorpha]KAH3891182.1 hypothetical protein DPMN_015271 [Dreissena polymorpha]
MTMAGSRVHRHGTIYKRVEGLIKSEALQWKDRPLWFDIWKKFPPQVEPKEDRPVPNVHVRKILYPEDMVRAKMQEVYEVTGTVKNLRTKWKGKSKNQLFVEEYVRLQKPGLSVAEVFRQVEQEFRARGQQFIRKPKNVLHNAEETEPQNEESKKS